MQKWCGAVLCLALAIVGFTAHAQRPLGAAELPPMQAAAKRLPKDCPNSANQPVTSDQSERWGALATLGNTLWAAGEDELLAFEWKNCRPGTIMTFTAQGQLNWTDSVEGIIYDGYKKSLGTQSYGVSIVPRSIEATRDGFTINWGMQRRRCQVGRSAITCTLEVDLGPLPTGYWQGKAGAQSWQPQETRTYRPVNRDHAVKLLVKDSQMTFGASMARWGGADRPHPRPLGTFNGLRTYHAMGDGSGPATFAFIRADDALSWVTFLPGYNPDRVTEFRKVSGQSGLQPVHVAEVSYRPSKEVATGPLEITPQGAIVVTTAGRKTHYLTSSSGVYALARVMTYDRKLGWVEKSRRLYSGFGDYRYGSTAGWGALARLPEGIWRTPAGLEVYTWDNKDKLTVARYTAGGKFLGECTLVRPSTGASFACSGGQMSVAFTSVSEGGFVRDGVSYAVTGERRDPKLSAAGVAAFTKLERTQFERIRIASYNREDAAIIAKNARIKRQRDQARAAAAPAWVQVPNPLSQPSPFLPDTGRMGSVPNPGVSGVDPSMPTARGIAEAKARLEFEQMEREDARRRGRASGNRSTNGSSSGTSTGGSSAQPQPYAKAYEQLARDRAASEDAARAQAARDFAASPAYNPDGATAEPAPPAIVPQSPAVPRPASRTASPSPVASASGLIVSTPDQDHAQRIAAQEAERQRSTAAAKEREARELAKFRAEQAEAARQAAENKRLDAENKARIEACMKSPACRNRPHKARPM